MAAWASVAFVIASLSLAAGVRQNVARNKTAWMSTTRQPSQSAGNAVDGVTTANSERYTAHTKVDESSAWWKVDLQTQVQSAQVTIYFRLDYKKRRNGLQLYTSVTNSSEPKDGSLCHTVTGSPDGTDIPGVLNVTCPGTWRYLTVYTNTSNDGQGAVLEFAEVEVWTCTSGYYGTNCGQRCGARHCKSDSSCDVIQGQCVGGCAAGYQGTDCLQACGPGRYGVGCSKSCGNRRCKTPSDICYHVTGGCSDGCISGYKGEDCMQSCGPGRYGERCSKDCSNRRCKTPSATCNHTTGLCSDGCASGYKGEDCLQTCTWDMYGPDCARECSSRHCETLSSTCDRVTGQCPDGCEVGWTEIDCTRNCADGFYGNNCSLKCADRHCTSTSCLGNGVCSAGCDVGWALQDCTQVCPRGTYGINCKSICGHCADHNTCQHVTGACPGGCQAGWQLDLCQTGDIGGAESQRGSAITPTTAGIIGLAAGICFMLILGVGLYVGLVRKWRLQWISSSHKDAVEVKETQVPVDKDTTQPSDNYTSISEQAGGRNIYNNDYAALDVEGNVNNEYEAIKNQAYENL